jgi:hypothetical protein
MRGCLTASMTPHDLFSEAKARQGRRRDRSGDVADEHLANMEANGTAATTSAVSGLWPEGRKSGIEPRSFLFSTSNRNICSNLGMPD